jgi:hypothetical protein
MENYLNDNEKKFFNLYTTLSTSNTVFSNLKSAMDSVGGLERITQLLSSYTAVEYMNQSIADIIEEEYISGNITSNEIMKLSTVFWELKRACDTTLSDDQYMLISTIAHESSSGGKRRTIVKNPAAAPCKKPSRRKKYTGGAPTTKTTTADLIASLDGDFYEFLRLCNSKNKDLFDKMRNASVAVKLQMLFNASKAKKIGMFEIVEKQYFNSSKNADNVNSLRNAPATNTKATTIEYPFQIIIAAQARKFGVFRPTDKSPGSIKVRIGNVRLYLKQALRLLAKSILAFSKGSKFSMAAEKVQTELHALLSNLPKQLARDQSVEMKHHNKAIATCMVNVPFAQVNSFRKLGFMRVNSKLQLPNSSAMVGGDAQQEANECCKCLYWCGSCLGSTAQCCTAC